MDHSLQGHMLSRCFSLKHVGNERRSLLHKLRSLRARALFFFLRRALTWLSQNGTSRLLAGGGTMDPSMEAVIAFFVKVTRASSSEWEVGGGRRITGEVSISRVPENRVRDNCENENFEGAASGLAVLLK